MFIGFENLFRTKNRVRFFTPSANSVSIMWPSINSASITVCNFLYFAGGDQEDQLKSV